MDAQAATNTYIDTMGPERLARATAYTTGNHWILIASLIISIIAAYLIARSKVLTHASVRRDDKPNRTAAITSAVFLILTALITLPWTLYTDWYRQHAYQRSSQPLGDFLGQWALSTVISAVLGVILLVVIYLALRRTGTRWWIWATGIVAAGMAILMLASPVIIEPLFNKFQPLPDGPVRDALIPMSVEAGVPADRLFVYDGSRQSNNFTANAGGIGSTARIAVSDIALKGATLDEVRAVTGHEIGHYVLKHSQWGILLISLLALACFLSAGRIYPTVARFLGISVPMTDPTGLPALLITISLVSFVATPFLNTMSRYFESQADRYSLEHVGEADGLATALVKTADYRNPRPSLIEEVIFYDHPSVERRIYEAMLWKSAHATTIVPAPDSTESSHREFD